MPTVKETCSCGATYEATHGAVVPSTDEFRAIHKPCRDRAAYGPPQNDDTKERLERARQALINTGYFTEDQVDPDIAPRITELGTYLREYVIRPGDPRLPPPGPSLAYNTARRLYERGVTEEPEAEQTPAWHVEHCRANLGDGEGNEWCTHDVQIAWAKPDRMPEGDDPHGGEPMPGLLSNYARRHGRPAAANPDRTTT